MATLMYEHGGVRRAGAIVGRIMIGRWPINTIAVNDAALSRVHAWIGRDASDDRFFVADSASRAGTFVNGQRVGVRQALRNGDEVRVGPVRLWISPGLVIPPDAEAVDLTPKSLAGREVGGGLFHDCVCGAPLWIPLRFLGRAGRCRYCARSVTVRPPARPAAADAPGALQPPVAAAGGPDTERGTCTICQSAVNPGEPSLRCPDCGFVFHRECWVENRGCATYGCPQVGTLDQTDGAPTPPRNEQEM
jgi:hypothetical protein